MLFLFSRLNNLITVFNLRDYEAGSSLPFSSSDAMMLKLDNAVFEDSAGSKHICSLHLEQLVYSEEEKGKGTGPGAIYADAEVRFSRLSVMLSDLSIYQTLLYSYRPEYPALAHPGLTVVPPAWQTIKRRTRASAESLESVTLEDGFIVPDGLDPVKKPTLRSPYRIRSHSQTSKRYWAGEGALSEESTAHDHSDMYSVLAYGDSTWTPKDHENLKTEDVTIVIDRVRDCLLQDLSEGTPRGTL
jgi:RNA polymerase I-specific transcription initiation factor RRN6